MSCCHDKAKRTQISVYTSPVGGSLPTDEYATALAVRNDAPLPTKFTANLTHRCNLACNMCTQYGGKFKNDKSPEISPEQWLTFFETIAWVRPVVTLFGGEPTIYRGFDEIVRGMVRLGIESEVVTNGYFLEAHLDAILEANTRVFLSVDGLPETHNHIRNSPDSFARLSAALEALRRCRERTGSPYLAFNFVLLPENLDDVEPFLEFALGSIPDRVTFQHPQFASKPLNQATAAVWRERLGVVYTTTLYPKTKYQFDSYYVRRLTSALDSIWSRSDFGKRVFLFPDLAPDEIALYYSDNDHFLLRPWRFCTKPWSRPTVDPNGDVSLCLDYFVGNITLDNFWDLWVNHTSDRLRRSLTSSGRFPICTRCCELYSR